jgi:uncharacterized protein YbaR (Trm112 family)
MNGRITCPNCGFIGFDRDFRNPYGVVYVCPRCRHELDYFESQVAANNSVSLWFLVVIGVITTLGSVIIEMPLFFTVLIGGFTALFFIAILRNRRNSE